MSPEHTLLEKTAAAARRPEQGENGADSNHEGPPEDDPEGQAEVQQQLRHVQKKLVASRTVKKIGFVVLSLAFVSSAGSGGLTETYPEIFKARGMPKKRITSETVQH